MIRKNKRLVICHNHAVRKVKEILKHNFGATKEFSRFTVDFLISKDYRETTYFLTGSSSGTRMRRKREKHRNGERKNSNVSRQEMEKYFSLPGEIQKVVLFQKLVLFCLFFFPMVGVIHSLVTL